MCSAGTERAEYSAGRKAGKGAEVPEPRTLRVGEPHGYHVFLIRPFSAPFCGPKPQNFPPAGGIGDWGCPSKRVCHTNAMLAPAPPTAALACAPCAGLCF